VRIDRDVEARLIYAIEVASGKKLWSQSVGQSTSSPAVSTEGRLGLSESLAPPNWRTETSVQSVDAARFTVTVPIANQQRFYRLCGL
jgi:outer membrane protein assembly factor BamB